MLKPEALKESRLKSCLFFDQIAAVPARQGTQPIANMLSTEAPTDFGYNLALRDADCGKPAKNQNLQRKSSKAALACVN
ncbi:hypothetical protein [Pseudomonas viridiflava]|uniref:hypothetical protein n=1 Tax=Pseudomonas viridiflava TaxID=33069 RepID=UPI00117A6104|nr:hypothetical protein [Pseudomonas viridiflava]